MIDYTTDTKIAKETQHSPSFTQNAGIQKKMFATNKQTECPITDGRGYFTSNMRNTNHTEILKDHLRHVSVQVRHLEAEQNASSSTNCQ